MSTPIDKESLHDCIVVNMHHVLIVMLNRLLSIEDFPLHDHFIVFYLVVALNTPSSMPMTMSAMSTVTMLFVTMPFVMTMTAATVSTPSSSLFGGDAVISIFSTFSIRDGW